MKKPIVKPWTPQSTDTEEERDMMIRMTLQEMSKNTFGDYSLYVGQDTLTLGISGDDGECYLYHCKILSSNVDAEEEAIEGAAYVLAKGLPS